MSDSRDVALLQTPTLLKGIATMFRFPTSKSESLTRANAAMAIAYCKVLLILCVVSIFGTSAAYAAVFDGRSATATASNYPSSPRYSDVNAVTFTVTGSAATPTGNVTYIVDTGTSQTVPLAGGLARANLGMLAPGSHSVSYTYAGDGTYFATATQTLSITVADLPFTLTGARRLVAGGEDFGYYSAFDKAGNLYTTETNNGIITKYDTSGNLTTVPSSGLTSPRGIVFDLAGNFYVADAGNDRIVKFTLNGSTFTQSVVNITGLSNPYTLAFNPATTVLYIADRNNNRIVTYNLATQVLTPVATGESLTGIAVDPAGNLYYGEFYGGLHKLDTQGNITDLFYTYGQPSGMAVDAVGNLYFSDSYTNGLLRYDTQGHLLQIGSINSAGIAIDKRGHLFFPEGTQLYEFVPGVSAEFGNISAGYLFNYGSTPIDDLSYQVPYNTSLSTITVPTAGTGFSTVGSPTCNGSGSSYCDSTFEFTPIYPGRGTGYAHATLSTGTTLDTLLYGNGYNPELAFSPGVQTAQTPGSTTPAGVTLDTLRVPYVSDSGANKVFKVPATGSALAIPFTGLNKPTQLAVDGAFSVYVLDSGNNRIVKVDSTGNQTVPFQLSQQTALTSLSAFYVDGAGTLFLAGNSGSAAAIYSLDLSGNYTALQQGITLPTVLLVDGFGNVFSGEGSTGVLREFDTLGNNTALTSHVPGISSLTEEPSGVFDVTQTGVGTVTAVGLDGTLSTLPVNGLTLPIATAVSPNADLYVLDATTLQLTNIVRSQPVSFVYGSVQVGATKTIAQSLFNTGNRAVTFTDALPGDTNFVAGTANQCVQGPLAAGASCNFAFTFTPTQVQDYNENGDIDTNTGGAGYVFENYPVYYIGTGTAAVATAVASPTTIAFGNVSLGTTSASQVVTLSNTGGAALTINAIALSGSSAVTQRSTTCGSTLGGGANCTVTLIFTPTARTASSATLTFTDTSSTGATQTVAITGTGVAPLLAISPGTVSFADTQSGSTSASQSLTVTNSGNAVANFNGITLAGADPTAFTLTNGCATTLAANASCTLTAVFTPNAVRTFNATVTVASDDPASPAIARLTGNGIAAGKLSISPVTQIFPLTVIGATSAGQTSILTNSSLQAISLSVVTLTDATDFMASGCGGSLPPLTSCSIVFRFTPKATGSLTSTYSVYDVNNPTNVVTVALSGPGAALPGTVGFVVNNTGDDANGVPSNCAAGNAKTCELRDALAAADADTSGAPITVTFDPTVFATPQTITLTNGPTSLGPNVNGVSIIGPGANLLTVSGNKAAPIFTFSTRSGTSSTSKIAISGMTITAGAGSYGGGIFNRDATLTLTNVVISNSTVVGTSGGDQFGGGTGGGILNGGSVTLIGSTITGNSATQGGGGISNYGTVALINSTVTGNTTALNGGGIYSAASSSLTLTNSTVAGNTAANQGGGIAVVYQSGEAVNSIIAGNFVGSGGSYADVAVMSNGTLSDGGGNLISYDPGASSTINPFLAPLGNYGGLTPTLIPLPGSTAICGGLTTSPDVTVPTTDQRGNPRPTSYGTTACIDAGSVQTSYSLAFVQQPTTTAVGATITPSPAVQLNESGSAFAASVTIPLTLKGAGKLSGGSAATSPTTGAATYSVSVDTPGTGDTLTAALVLDATPNAAADSPIRISAVSAPFDVTGLATAMATLSPATATYGSITAGTTGPAQTFILSKAGTASLSITSVMLGGANAGTFAIASNTCTGTLAAGARCAVSVTFNPSAAGTYSATLSVVDAVGTQTSTLSGSATAAVVLAPLAALTPTAVSYGSVTTGSSSAAQTFTVTNAGNAALTITSVSLGGANASAFAITAKTCGSSLSAGTSCTVSATFNPTSAGSFNATLSVVDTVGTQTSTLSGSATNATSSAPADFALAATPASQSSYRGTSVTYTLQLTSLVAANPFTQAAVLSATNLPSGSSVSFAPASVVPGVSSPATTVMTVAIPGLASESKPLSWPGKVPVGLSLATLLFGVCLPRTKRRHALRLLSLALLMAIAGSMVGCGTGTGFAVGTSTSSIVVTATSGETAHSTTVTLTIQ